jgi:hypothetical protein
LKIAQWWYETNAESQRDSARLFADVGRRLQCCRLAIIKTTRSRGGLIIHAHAQRPRYTEALSRLEQLRPAKVMLVVSFRGSLRMVGAITVNAPQRAWVTPELLNTN